MQKIVAGQPDLAASFAGTRPNVLTLTSLEKSKKFHKCGGEIVEVEISTQLILSALQFGTKSYAIAPQTTLNGKAGY
ncbi:MAG: hypothetical protein V4677_16065 [Bacteroidota bacterium]